MPAQGTHLHKAQCDVDVSWRSSWWRINPISRSSSLSQIYCTWKQCAACSAVQWRNKFCLWNRTASFFYPHLAPYFFRTRWFINRTSRYPSTAALLSMSSESYILFSDDLFLSAYLAAWSWEFSHRAWWLWQWRRRLHPWALASARPSCFSCPWPDRTPPKPGSDTCTLLQPRKEIRHLISCFCLAK